MFNHRRRHGAGMMMMSLVSVALTVPLIYYMKKIDDSLHELVHNSYCPEDSES